MKKNYLISIVVIGLVILSLYSTYAMFTETVETDEIINMNASIVSLDSKIVEYERIEVITQEKKTIEFTVNNDSDKTLYYGVWYEMVNPNKKNDNIVIGKKEDTQNDTMGQLIQGTSVKVTFVIENNTESTIILNIGVGYSNDNNLNLPTNRYLITEVYKEKIIASEYIESLLSSNPNTINNDDPDKNVRYMGADPNNYVLFNNELWQIIGVFNVASTDGGSPEKRLKIIRSQPLGNMEWDSNNTNDWANSTLQKYLNNDFYNSLAQKNFIGDALWNLGGTNAFTTALASDFYTYERGTDVYNGHSTYWIGKIGLMYPSDYGYATSGGVSVNRNSCLLTNLYSWNNKSYVECSNNNFLFNSEFYQWTITPFNVVQGGVFRVYYISMQRNVIRDQIKSKFGVSPVIYLNSTVQITGGNGTSENPFILEQGTD